MPVFEPVYLETDKPLKYDVVYGFGAGADRVRHSPGQPRAVVVRGLLDAERVAELMAVTEAEGEEFHSDVDGAETKTTMWELEVDPQRNVYRGVREAFALANKYFKFQLDGFYEKLRIQGYAVGDLSETHSDYTPVDPSKVTMVCMLSDPLNFDGGESAHHPARSDRP